MDSNLTHVCTSHGYTYTPLRGKDTIRIAYLSRVGNQLHARLEQVEISRSPKYCALSYVWRWSPKLDTGLAENNQTKPIYLDGCEIQVTANLADFIDAITAPRPEATPATPRPPPLPYWIDAICIDQSHDAEKSAQVRMMREIYDSATCITIWLGRHDQDSRRCIDKMKMCASTVRALYLNVNQNHPAALEGDVETRTVRILEIFCEYLQENLNVLDKDGGLVDQEGWGKLAQFFHDRQWWNRMWTVQEYLPNVEKIFLCGDSTFPSSVVSDLSTMRAMLETVSLSHSEDCRITRPQFEAVFRMEYFRSFFHQSQSEGVPLCVYDTLRDLRCRVATDPRDKVFAVLGLTQADGCRDSLLSVDYSLSVATVFTNIAKYLLKTRDSLEWLAYSGTSSVSDLQSRQYPSWVPRWEDMGNPHALPDSTETDDGSKQLLYSPWGSRGHGLDIENTACIVETNDQAELHVYGAFLDEIRATYETPTSISDVGTHLGWIERVNSELGAEYSATCEPMWRAALRTMVLDIERVGRQSFIRPPAGLDDLPCLPVADRVQQFMFGTVGNSIAAMILHLWRRHVTMSRRLAVTRRGYICLAPEYTRVGDQVCALVGGHVLYIVRREPNGPESYTFVGETYVHGLMDGEWRDREGEGCQEPAPIILA